MGVLVEREAVAADIPDVDISPRPDTPLTDGERLETLGLLAAGLAHEVASPLQALIHNLRYLEDGLAIVADLCAQAEALPGDGASPQLAALRDGVADLSERYPVAELQAALVDSVDAAQRASAMVRAIAEFAGAGTAEESLDVGVVITSVTTLTRNAWKYIAEIDTVVPPDLPKVRATPRAIAVDLARALLDAARRLAEREGGLAVQSSRILVDVSRHGSTLEVGVTAAGHRYGLSLPVAEA